MLTISTSVTFSEKLFFINDHRWWRENSNLSKVFKSLFKCLSRPIEVEKEAKFGVEKQQNIMQNIRLVTIWNRAWVGQFGLSFDLELSWKSKNLD